MKKLPPLDYLSKILNYDPETGDLFWAEDRGFRIKAGDEAGTAVQMPSCYRLIMIDSSLYKVHRIAWMMANGRDPGDGEVIAINGKPGDIRASNLKLVSSKNRGLRVKHNTSNTSGALGVSRHRETGKWRARIRVKGKSVSLGLFDMKEQAAGAVQEAKMRLLKEAEKATNKNT